MASLKDEPSESIDSAWADMIARSRRSSSMVNCRASLCSSEPLSLRPLTCIAVSLAHGSTCEPAIYLGPSSPQVLRTSIAPRASLHRRASADPSRPLVASRFSVPKVRPEPVFYLPRESSRRICVLGIRKNQDPQAIHQCRTSRHPTSTQTWS